MPPSFEIKHVHYTALDQAKVPQPAYFKVYKDGALVAVVREPFDIPLIGEPKPNENYRVDCESAPDDLKAAIEGYFPAGRRFAYFFAEPFTWKDKGSAEEMPWGTRID